MRIDRLTVRAAVTVSPDTTVRRAARTMAEHGVGCLVVTDHDRLVGVVTDRDLVTRALAADVPSDGRIDAVMSMDVITVDAGADVRDVVRMFGQHAVRRIPIITENRVTGVVSLDDMLATAGQQLAELTNGLTAQLLFPHAADEPPVPVAVDRGSET